MSLNCRRLLHVFYPVGSRQGRQASNMKTAYFVIIGPSCFPARAGARRLCSSPAFPQDTSTVTITVNCNLGNQGLLTAGGTGVYAYMGLITSSSTSPSDWLHVPAACVWGTANPAVAATYLGNNQYSFTIPNIRSYFGVPAGEVIYKVAILFWGNSGNIAQRNADGSDMFVPGILPRPWRIFHRCPLFNRPIPRFRSRSPKPSAIRCR